MSFERTYIFPVSISFCYALVQKFHGCIGPRCWLHFLKIHLESFSPAKTREGILESLWMGGGALSALRSTVKYLGKKHLPKKSTSCKWMVSKTHLPFQWLIFLKVSRLKFRGVYTFFQQSWKWKIAPFGDWTPLPETYFPLPCLWEEEQF